MNQDNRGAESNGSKNNFRKAFKPNFGGGNDNETPNRPPLNSRLKQKLPQKYGGMRNDTEEDHVEYQPTKRTGSLRSSRVNDPKNVRKTPTYQDEAEIGNNVPRASKPNKQTMGHMGSSNRAGHKASKPATFKKPSMGGGSKPAQGAYQYDFGDDAYEQPTNLTPCPSCGRKFNDEALNKHKKVCQKVFQTKAKKFNMQKQRVLDGEHKQLLVNSKKEERKFGGLKNKSKRTGNLPGSKQNKWLAKSSAFRNAMRAARGAKPLDSGYGGAGAPVNDDEANGFIPCPH